MIASMEYDLDDTNKNRKRLLQKLKLDFRLPEERTELFQALQGADWELCLWQLDEFLRAEIKYKDKPWQSVRDKLHEIKNNLGLEFSP